MRLITLFLRFFRFSQRGVPLIVRITRAKRLTTLVVHHQKSRETTLRAVLKEQQPQETLLRTSKQAFLQAQETILRLFRRHQQQVFEGIKGSTGESKTFSERSFEVVSKHLGNFYKSVQALVEGRRQVLNDPTFVLQDGQSVEEKRVKFEQKVQLLMSRMNRQQ